ncbi:MAG: DNA gyrase inhibitor YacG [Azoarcus sp.]|nr:DNA gyrase inhibitor YacG [Azoarcus sp.]
MCCPQCGGKAEWSEANPYRPFCSARCKQIDLGAWASGQYRVPASPPRDGESESFPG